MTPDLLLELQSLDTQTDQLRHRRDHLPEQVQRDAAAAAMKAWSQRRDGLLRSIAELGATIERAEHDGGEIATHKKRLEAQLKTVIAPREAEALMHEIATLDERRDEIDLAELTAMEEQSTAEEDLANHETREGELRRALDEAEEALATTVAAIDDELSVIVPRADELRSQLDATERARYDKLRKQLGSAVAKLEGVRCSGCHLDLSAAEADDARDDAAATGVTDCPNCGRMLVIT